MSDPTRRVTCANHGQTPATFVCNHLRDGVGCGFHCSQENAEDRWPDAWCDGCEALFQRQGRWTSENEPKISVVCTTCYEAIRQRNRLSNLLAELGPPPVSDALFERFAAAVCERCKARQNAVSEAWPGFLNSKRWDFDDEASTISFSTPGDPANGVLADVTLVGSFSTRTETWLWSWGNDNYPDAARAKVDPLRVFGEIRGIYKFAFSKWPAEEVDAWEVTQIAAELLGSEAVYRARFDHLFVFMLLDNFRPS